jgi:hypothetical protein
MKVLNAPEYAELIHNNRLHFTDTIKLNENGHVIKMQRIERPSVETEAVELNVKEDRVEIGKYEINLDNHIVFTIKG